MFFRICLIIFNSVLLCQSISWARDAGVVLSTKGLVQAQGANSQIRTLVRGRKIFSGDSIITSELTRAHIRFQDGTIVGIRPNSVFKVNQYRFSAKTPKQNRFRAEMLKGQIRAITGAISKKNKEAFEIKTPVATLGIRGTVFTIYSDDDQTAARVDRGEIKGTHNETGFEQTLTNEAGQSGAQPVSFGIFTTSSVKPFVQTNTGPIMVADSVETIASDNLSVESRQTGIIGQSTTPQLTNLVSNEDTEDGAPQVIDTQSPIIETTTSTVVNQPDPMLDVPNMTEIGFVTLNNTVKGVRAVSNVSDPLFGVQLPDFTGLASNATLNQADINGLFGRGTATLGAAAIGRNAEYLTGTPLSPGVVNDGVRWGYWQNNSAIITDIENMESNVSIENLFWIIGNKTPVTGLKTYGTLTLMAGTTNTNESLYSVGLNGMQVDYTNETVQFLIGIVSEPSATVPSDVFFLTQDVSTQHLVPGANYTQQVTFGDGEFRVDFQGAGYARGIVLGGGGGPPPIQANDLNGTMSAFSSGPTGDTLNVAFSVARTGAAFSASGVLQLTT